MNRKQKAKKILAIVMLCFVLASCEEQIIANQVGEFVLEDILYIDDLLVDFTPEILIGEEVFLDEFKTAEEVAIGVEEIWIDFYGEDHIKEQRPYIVKVDENNNLWLVYGDYSYLNGALGGVAYAIVSREDGKVIVFWHDE